MDMDTRNGIAELVLEALENPQEAYYIDVLESYCNQVEQTNSFIVPVPSLQLPFPVTQKIIEPLIHSRLFNLNSSKINDNDDETNPNRVLPLETKLFLDSSIETDIDYITLRVHAGYKIIEFLRKNPVPEHKDKIEDGIIKAALLFNNQLYFETHEILEAIWLEEVGKIRLFLQGIIQVAVGFHHLLNGNYNGAVSLTRDGSTKMRPYAPVQSGLDVRSFLEGVDKCRDALGKLNRERVNQFDWQLVPKMKIIE